MCASPDTPVATPAGERPIASLQPGDLVYSVDHAALAVVPITRVNRVPVFHHRVVRLRLSNGRTLEVSGTHPLGDGRFLSELRGGAVLDGVRVVAVEEVPYAYEFTYDILPSSSSGSYFAAGIELRSTLGP